MKQYNQGIKTDVMSQHKDELWKEWGRNALKPCINPPQGAPATHPEPSVSPRSEPLPVFYVRRVDPLVPEGFEGNQGQPVPIWDGHQ